MNSTRQRKMPSFNSEFNPPRYFKEHERKSSPDFRLELGTNTNFPPRGMNSRQLGSGQNIQMLKKHESNLLNINRHRERSPKFNMRENPMETRQSKTNRFPDDRSRNFSDRNDHFEGNFHPRKPLNSWSQDFKEQPFDRDISPEHQEDLDEDVYSEITGLSEKSLRFLLEKNPELKIPIYRKKYESERHFRDASMENTNAGPLRNPNAGLLRNPKEGLLRNPKEGLLRNPKEGLLRNPKAGLLRNPNVEPLRNQNPGLLRNPIDANLAEMDLRKRREGIFKNHLRHSEDLHRPRGNLQRGEKYIGGREDLRYGDEEKLRNNFSSNNEFSGRSRDDICDAEKECFKMNRNRVKNDEYNDTDRYSRNHSPEMTNWEFKNHGPSTITRDRISKIEYSAIGRTLRREIGDFPGNSQREHLESRRTTNKDLDERRIHFPRHKPDFADNPTKINRQDMESKLSRNDLSKKLSRRPRNIEPEDYHEDRSRRWNGSPSRDEPSDMFNEEKYERYSKFSKRPRSSSRSPQQPKGPYNDRNWVASPDREIKPNKRPRATFINSSKNTSSKQEMRFPFDSKKRMKDEFSQSDGQNFGLKARRGKSRSISPITLDKDSHKSSRSVYNHKLRSLEDIDDEDINRRNERNNRFNKFGSEISKYEQIGMKSNLFDNPTPQRSMNTNRIKSSLDQDQIQNIMSKPNADLRNMLHKKPNDKALGKRNQFDGPNFMGQEFVEPTHGEFKQDVPKEDLRLTLFEIKEQQINNKMKELDREMFENKKRLMDLRKNRFKIP